MSGWHRPVIYLALWGLRQEAAEFPGKGGLRNETLSESMREGARNGSDVL